MKICLQIDDVYSTVVGHVLVHLLMHIRQPYFQACPKIYQKHMKLQYSGHHMKIINLKVNHINMYGFDFVFIEHCIASHLATK